MLRFTDHGKTDKKLREEVLSTVKDIRKNGIPKTLEGLKDMFRIYNQVFGQNKKLTNCIYCRKTVAESLEKAVLLLDIKPKETIKTEGKNIPSQKKKRKRITKKK